MKTAIYWFSGTGNCLAVARALAGPLEAELVSMASTRGQTAILPKAEAIGLVFPAYMAQKRGIPVIVDEFVARLGGLEGKYLFAVCTCGGWELVNALPTLRWLAQEVRRRGGILKGQFSVHLPMNNLTYPSPLVNQDQASLFAAAATRVSDICRRVALRQRSAHHWANSLFNRLMLPMYALVRHLYVVHVRQMSQEPEDTRLDYSALIRASDKSIRVEAACNGCGTCVRVCPVGNIALVAGKPEWQHHCEMCMACDEWCPQRAIRHWCKTPGLDYRHPEVSLADMLGQASGGNKA